jgi:formylglycine-generating enzyme required for sulfatase activity
LVVAVIVVGVAVFLFKRGNGPAPGTVNARAHVAAPTRLAGFRSDAWMLPADDLLGFVSVPAGPFKMGSDKSVDAMALDNERWSPTEAQGAVELSDFYIARYEVTIAQYQAFVAATRRGFQPQAFSAPANHPVTFVSWPDALAYCRWLEHEMKSSATLPATLKQKLDAGWHISLPSEAQWEKAGRGAGGHRYPWGAAPRADRANIGREGSVPVGSISCPECAYGLSDMSGNVWEWTRSPYQPYPYDPSDDSKTLGLDALWVIRGGGFNDSEQMARASARGAADPGARRPFIGFRLVISQD